MMKHLLLASAGGALGAGARYLVYVEFTRRWGASFPWATLTVNVVGSLLIGVLSALLLERFPDGADLRVFIFTGILVASQPFQRIRSKSLRCWSEDQSEAR